MSKKDDISFLEAYLRELESSARTIKHVCPADCTTPEKILSDVPTRAEQERQLLKLAEYLVKSAKKANTPSRADRLAEALSDSKVRSKRAACLVARKKKAAESRIKDLSKPDANPKRAARLANDNGFDGGLFFRVFNEPVSLQSIRNLAKQIETIPQIIAAIEKPIDKSIIPDGTALLNVPQVARLLGWGDSTLRQRVKQELLPIPQRFDGTIQWRKDELENWMKHDCPPRQKWESIKQANRNRTINVKE